MKKVSFDQFLIFTPCYTEEQIRVITGYKSEYTAIDVLNMENLPTQDRLWAVLREEFIEAPLLHEFACRCADLASTRVGIPDTRSIQAIKAKRAWLQGEISDIELKDARNDAACAVSEALDVAWSNRKNGLDILKYDWRFRNVAYAVTDCDARWASMDAVGHSCANFYYFSGVDKDFIRSNFRKSERLWQIKELKKMLEEVGFR